MGGRETVERGMEIHEDQVEGLVRSFAGPPPHRMRGSRRLEEGELSADDRAVDRVVFDHQDGELS